MLETHPLIPDIPATLLWGVLAFAALPVDAAPDPYAEAIQARVQLAGEGGLTIGTAPVVSSFGLSEVYGRLGFQPLWRDGERVVELIRLIQQSAEDGLLPTDYHLTELVRRWWWASADPTPDNVAELDVLASDAYMLLLYHLYFGKVDPATIEPTWNYSSREISGIEAVDFVADALASGRLRDAVDAARPDHWMYQNGRVLLGAYRALAARGGWPQVPAGDKLEPGISDPRVPVLRQRLAVTGDLRDQPLDSDLYDEALTEAVRAFQERHRLTADGVVGPATLAELNVPVDARIRQIRVNLERARQVLHTIGDEDMVIVDIAGYEVRYVQDRRVIWTSRAVVGQPFRQTPIFTAEIEYVVLNPTWTVPPGILEKDILPAVRRDPSYLSRRGLEVVDRTGRPIDPATISWSRYGGNNFPYFVRQQPGDSNALGRVKIMFPNQYLVYLHDTPSKNLFDRDDRAFSSGCIRVQKPLELVERLMADPAWTTETLTQAVKSDQPRTLRLAKPVRVLLLYWTVDQDESGRVVFKRDIYGRDARLARALDAPFDIGSRPSP